MSCLHRVPGCYGPAQSVVLHVCDACLDVQARDSGEERQYLHCVCVPCAMAEEVRPWPERRWRHKPGTPFPSGDADPDPNEDSGPSFIDMESDS